MASHKLHIACIVTLAMLGLGQHVEAASLKLTWNHSPSTNVAGHLVSHGAQSGKYSTTVKAVLRDFGQYHRVDRRDDVLLRCIVARQGRHERPTVARSLWSVSAPTLAISCPSPVLTSPDGSDVGDADSHSHRRSDADLDELLAGNQAHRLPWERPRSHATPSTPHRRRRRVRRRWWCRRPGEPAPAPQDPRPSHGRPHPSQRPHRSQNRHLSQIIGTPLSRPSRAHRLHLSQNRGRVEREGVVSRSVFSDGTVPVTVSCEPKSGSLFPLGTTTVSCRATNAAGCVGCVHDDGDSEGPPEF